MHAAACVFCFLFFFFYFLALLLPAALARYLRRSESHSDHLNAVPSHADRGTAAPPAALATAAAAAFLSAHLPSALA